MSDQAPALTPAEAEALSRRLRHNDGVQKRIVAEDTVIRSFVHHILADKRGFTISLYDGGEWVVKRSRDKEAIIAAMRSADEDVLRVRTAAGDSFGSVVFVYGNAGYEVASDWTDTKEFNALIAPAIKTMQNQQH